ncbi:hypothetical protein [Methylomonas sp. AM2-LC]|uniref:hypothetical protein n=1 Tax=Methylomonas sp. AM2-LC TaxID=3153301 RepID=UPI00326409B7
MSTLTMKTLTKPFTQRAPQPRTEWNYDIYFLEQLAKKKKTPNNNNKAASN